MPKPRKALETYVESLARIVNTGTWEELKQANPWDRDEAFRRNAANWTTKGFTPTDEFSWALTEDKKFLEGGEGEKANVWLRSWPEALYAGRPARAATW